MLVDWTPVLLALPLYAVAIGWGWGPDRLWSWDEPRPVEVLAEPYGAAPSWPAKYPLLHRDLLHGLYSAVAPAARAAGVSDPVALDRALLLSGRALTLLLALATVRLAFLLGRELGGRIAGRLAAIAWLAVLPQVYYAKTTNLDAPYLFWFALALVGFVRLRAGPSARRGLAFGAAAAAAILTKDQAYALFVLPALLLLWDLRRRETRPAMARALAAATGAGAAMAAVSYRLWNGTGWLRAHLRAVVAHPETYGFTSPDLDGRWDAFGLAIRHVAWSFGAPLFLFVAVLSAFALRRRVRRPDERARPASALFLFPVSYALFGLAPLGYQYDRFFLPVCFALVVIAAVELGRRSEAAPAARLRVAMTLTLLAAVGWGVARAVAIDRAMLGDRRVALEVDTAALARAAAFTHAVRAPHAFAPLLDPARKPHAAVPLVALSPYVLVAIPRADLGDFGLSRLAHELRGGACGFRETRPDLAAASPLSRFPGFAGVLSNLGEIDPPLLLFARQDGPGPC